MDSAVSSGTLHRSQNIDQMLKCARPLAVIPVASRDVDVDLGRFR